MGGERAAYVGVRPTGDPCGRLPNKVQDTYLPTRAVTVMIHGAKQYRIYLAYGNACIKTCPNCFSHMSLNRCQSKHGRLRLIPRLNAFVYCVVMYTYRRVSHIRSGVRRSSSLMKSSPIDHDEYRQFMHKTGVIQAGQTGSKYAGCRFLPHKRLSTLL